MSSSRTATISIRGGFAAFRPPPPTTERRSLGGPLLSLIFHAALIVGTYATWQHMLAPAEETHAVPVDLVVTEQTNVAAQAPPPDKIDIPKPSLEAPPLPEFSQLEPAPVPPIPQIKIAPEKTETDSDQAQKKPTAQDFSALLNKLTQAQAPPKDAKTGPRTVQGIGNANLATATLVDALRSQVGRCWSVGALAGSPNPADLVVDFQLKLNRDGSVATLAMLPSSVLRASTNNYTRAATDAASRAIYQCAPYKLPAERYSEWAEINPFHFDPRQMMGQ